MKNDKSFLKASADKNKWLVFYLFPNIHWSMKFYLQQVASWAHWVMAVVRLNSSSAFQTEISWWENYALLLTEEMIRKRPLPDPPSVFSGWTANNQSHDL